MHVDEDGKKLLAQATFEDLEHDGGLAAAPRPSKEHDDAVLLGDQALAHVGEVVLVAEKHLRTAKRIPGDVGIGNRLEFLVFFRRAHQFFRPDTSLPIWDLFMAQLRRNLLNPPADRTGTHRPYSTTMRVSECDSTQPCEKNETSTPSKFPFPSLFILARKLPTT